MYKSLLETFTNTQLEILKGKMWWVADPNKPYLIKYASTRDFALMELTDLRSLWVAKIPAKTLMEDKMKYAKSLQIKETKDLMNLLETLLSTSDSDPRTTYQFKQAQFAQMFFTFKKMIEIFDFNWTFKLKKTTCNPVQLICKELLTPLATALQAQSNRIQQIKRKFEQVEKDYIRKMTEMQKKLYRSPLIQIKDDWQQLIPKFDGALLSLHKPDKFTEFCFSNFAVAEKKLQKPQISLPVYSQHKPKNFKQLIFEEDFELADSILTQQLEQERRKQKKQKKIDFI